MKFFFLFLSFFTINSLSAQWTQVGSDIDGEAAYNQSGISVSMPDSITLAIGAQWNDGNGINSGHVRIYKKVGTSWIQKGNDIDGEAANDYFGYPVSMPDTNTVAIGGRYNDGAGFEAGHVRIYKWSGSSWIQKGIDIDAEAAGDNSGEAVHMPDSNTVAIGAQYNDGNGSDAGHVRIYSWSGSAWVQKGNDIDGEGAGDRSGAELSMPDSNTVAVGAPFNDGNGSDAGHVRIFKWSGSNWVQVGSDIDGEGIGDNSSVVSMPDSNTLAIGASRNDGVGIDAGHVRVYTWSGSLWVQKGADIDGEAIRDQSGASVSMADSNTLAIGARFNDGNGLSSGHVRIYEWSGFAWTQKGTDIDGEASSDVSGFSVSLFDRDNLAIGARLNDGNGIDAGHVRVYRYDSITTSFDESDIKNSISIFPNPSNGQLSIELNEYSTLPLLILDLSGKIVQEIQFNSRRNNLDLRELAEGIYFVRYGEVTKKLVIAR